MKQRPFSGGHFRKVWSVELDEFRDHLLRLDTASRTMRFGRLVSDEQINDYAAHALEGSCRIWGFFGPRGNMRGSAELRKIPDQPGCAEAAFTVEPDYQGYGVGTELMKRVVRSARNRHYEHLYLYCLNDNRPMRNVARKFNGQLEVKYGDVKCDLVPEHATPLTWLQEMIEDGSGLVLAMHDMQTRWIDAA